MKITVITGSPRKESASTYLAKEFSRGAREKGHEVYMFDSAHSDVKNCIGCNHCEMGGHPCIYKDDFTELRGHILESDVIVLATPIYYFGFSAQIKKIIDRMYCIDNTLKEMNKGIIMLSVQHAHITDAAEALNLHYKTIAMWLNMHDLGIINACGVENLSDMQYTPYGKEAYELGKSL